MSEGGIDLLNSVINDDGGTPAVAPQRVEFVSPTSPPTCTFRSSVVVRRRLFVVYINFKP